MGKHGSLIGIAQVLLYLVKMAPFKRKRIVRAKVEIVG